MHALSVKVQWMLFKMTYLYLSGNNDHGRMVLNQTFTIGNIIYSFQVANYKVDLVKIKLSIYVPAKYSYFSTSDKWMFFRTLQDEY